MKMTRKNTFLLLIATMILCFLPAVRANAENESGWAGKVWWFHADKSKTLIIGWNTDSKADMDDYSDGSATPWAGKTWFSDIKTINVKNNVKSIGNYAFADSDIEEVIFEDNSVCTEIGAHAFKNCTSLQKVTFGSKPKLTWINKYAFSDCDALKKISLPSTLKKISSGAFQVSGLESITLPRYCGSLGTDVFKFCRDLKAISVHKKNRSLSSKNGVLFYKKKTKLIQYPVKKKGTIYQMPSTVTTITGYAFSGSEGLAICPKVKILKMSKKIKTIGEKAFVYTDIKRIYFPGKRPVIKGGKMFDPDMVVTIYYKKAYWPKKYRKNYGAKKVYWKGY